MGMGQNIDFSRETDQIFQQDCDQTVKFMVEKLGWEEDWRKIKNEEMFL